MEQRKLIRLGNSSFAIALPKDWVDKSGLKKGDDIFVERNSNGEIIISPEFKKINEGKGETINLEGKEEKEIARDIISAYVGGYGNTNVNGNKDKLKIAKKIAKQFLNLELIDESEKKAIFKDLLDVQSVNIANFIRRMDNNIKDMFSVLNSINIDDRQLKKRIEELNEIDKDITKFYFLIWRLMNMGIDNPSIQTNLKINSKSFVTFFWLSYNIEQTGDELKRIGRRLATIKGNKDYFKQVLNSIKENYDNSMKAFFEKNKNYAKEVIFKKDETAKMCEKLANIKGFEVITEKLHQINANIHNNSKMIFYELKNL